jgi:beta-lactam-binding protein with PASTA domain
MKLPWRRNEVSRGQALVEFAIVLPVLALLLVMALDFGRVYFGWVSLTNAARVGANYASSHSDAWSAGRTAEIDEFKQLVRDNVTGCTLADPGSPQFIDMNADGDTEGSSDQVNVTLNCSFDLITPLASAVMGTGAISVAAESIFPVRGQYDGPTGAGGNPPCAGIRIPDLRLRTVTDAQQLWTDLTFAGTFTVDPTGQPDYIIQTQSFTPSANVNDCVDPSTSVFVRAVPPPPCPSGQAQVPNLMNMTLTDARLAWTAATFTGTFTPANGNNAKVVLTQITNPASVPNGCLVTSATVVVTYGDPPPPQCPVPNMVGHSVSEAQDMWTANGFTRALQVTGNGTGNVKTQDPGFPGTVDCDIRGKINT